MRERGRERYLKFRKKITNLALLIKITHQGLSSVSITPNSMTYRDTEYLKNLLFIELNKHHKITFSVENF